jgi:hypothetical protein
VIKLFEWEFRDRRPAVGAGKTGLGRITKWSTSLRILVLYANPVTASFGATLHREVVKTLRSRGHEINWFLRPQRKL